jgi:uncharacterized protein (TIGR03790 family)
MSRLAISFLILLSASVLNAEDHLAAATMVLFNSNDPDSVKLARYYATVRAIPSDQVVGFELPSTEDIPRADFKRLLADPLRNKLVEKGWWMLRKNGGEVVADTRIRFLAIIRGVPLKISPDTSIGPASVDPELPKAITSRNEASVDSELAALGLPDYKAAGFVPNPYFGRFTPILDEAMPPGLLLPSRLDAPTPEIVRAMIDDAVATEKEGLWGWAYVDGRDITSGGYFEGDNWMRNLVKILRERGVPTIFDNLPTTFGENFPVTDAAVYFGWYAGDINGPFLRDNFRFRRGAVAVHLHSFSAASLRGMKNYWSAPLIARGAAATLGNVYEPYLSFTANLDVFQDRLMAGLTLAEAGWMSQRALGWMGIVVGDPLYKPYAAWNLFSDPRQRKPNSFRQFRSITLASRSNILLAMLPMHEASRETGDSMFLEALGNAQMDAEHFAPALDSFRDALKLAKDPEVRVRLELEIAFVSRRVLPKEFKEEPPQPTPEPSPKEFQLAETESDPILIKPKPAKTPGSLPYLPYPDL